MQYNHVHARLIERNSNFEQWANANGYNPRTVTYAIKRWAGKTEQQPRGRTTHKILKEMSQFIEQEIMPGILQEETI